MTRINPEYRRYRISNSVFTDPERRKTETTFSAAWQRLNHSDFHDASARRDLLNLANPKTNTLPAVCRTIFILRTINSLSDLQHDVKAGRFLSEQLSGESNRTIRELAAHRIATTAASPNEAICHITQARGYVPDELQPIFRALVDRSYQANPAWLENTRRFTQEILGNIFVDLLADGTPSEPALASIVAAESPRTYQRVSSIIDQAEPALANRLRADRNSFADRLAFAYHFTTEEFLLSIASLGLSAQFAPAGSVSPDKACFNNAYFAGIGQILLGIGGYYVRPYLLRVKLSEAPFEPERRHLTEELMDRTADFLLDRCHVIPPDKIELVDPLIATRAIPLIVEK